MHILNAVIKGCWAYVSYFPKNVGNVVQPKQSVTTFEPPSLMQQAQTGRLTLSPLLDLPTRHPIGRRLATPGYVSEAKGRLTSRAGIAAER